MSERWEASGWFRRKNGWVFETGFGEVVVWYSDVSRQWMMSATQLRPLDVQTEGAAQSEAERIIRDRCRETLKLLGEE